jgi:hypothetical protein
MTVTELIDALSAQGITATSAQIEAELGSTEHLTADDIPAIAEMLGATSARGKGRKSGSKLAKSAPAPTRSEMTAPTLPSTAQIQRMDASELTAEIARLNQVDHSKRDNAMLETLAALYQRQQELTQLANAAGQALTAGNQAMQQAYQSLNGAVVGALRGFGQIDDVLDQFAGEGATLAANFRNSANLERRFNDLIDSPAA